MGPLNDPNTPAAGAPPPPGDQPLMPEGMQPTSPGSLPPAPPVPPPQAPNMPSSKPEVSMAGGSSKKPMMIAIIIVLVIAILGVGGYFAYNSMNKPAAQDTTVPPTTDTSGADVNNLKSETDQVDIADPDKDLTAVDQEINLLEATPSASVKPTASPKASTKASASAKVSPSPSSTTIDR